VSPLTKLKAHSFSSIANQAEAKKTPIKASDSRLMSSRSKRSENKEVSDSVDKAVDSNLSVVGCPDCGVQLLKLESQSNANPGRIFFKCRNNKSVSDIYDWAFTDMP
jgi:hypothetical protein